MNTFITKQRAAELLGVSERTIFRFLERCYLRPAKQGGESGVFQEDVLALREVREKEKTRDHKDSLPFAINAKTIGALHARISALECRMATVLRMLGISAEPLRLTDPEIAALYEQAVNQSETGWSPYHEDQWCDLFERLRHEDLEQLERVTGDAHPWRPFARLASTMFLAPCNSELRGQLAAGRNHLRQLALVWVHLQGASVKQAELLVEDGEAPNRRLVRRRERESVTLS